MNGHADWVRRHYEAGSDRLDADAFLDGLAEDVVLRQGAVATRGHTALRAAIDSMRSNGMLALEHHLLHVWEPNAEVTIVEGTVRYVRTSGSTEPLPVVTVFEWTRGFVSEIRVYVADEGLPSGRG
ncbi:nuclear transport factor 2 family protein [Rhodococcus fascians]|nr:nuclear transport factor 2 family protein [Rhodococcus fascians]MBY3995183.1 nuclear transport factor 2 family protein [Rhodococcus fascians]MBY4000497.1 nuclear transport factor 2 family protein [Rhodococcus fascians]MBY4005525.1 nuclear transport factor 2 family protein [Rhodococcus fascians]MBY4016358.1 nuclear transport factor 2 family protein [Rhodococcus fascians]